MTKKPLGKVKILNKAEASIDLKVTMKDIVEAVVNDEENRLDELISATNEARANAQNEFNAELKNVNNDIKKYMAKKYAKDLKPLRAQFDEINCVPVDTCKNPKIYLNSTGVFLSSGHQDSRCITNLHSNFKFSGKIIDKDITKFFDFTFLVLEEDYNNIKSIQKATIKRKEYSEAEQTYKDACREKFNLSKKSKQFKSQLVKNLLENTEEGRTLLQSMKSTKNLVRKALVAPNKK